MSSSDSDPQHIRWDPSRPSMAGLDVRGLTAVIEAERRNFEYAYRMCTHGDYPPSGFYPHEYQNLLRMLAYSGTRLQTACRELGVPFEE